MARRGERSKWAPRARGAQRASRALVAGVTLLACATLAACRPSGAVHSALEEDLPSLRRSIASEQRAGRIDRGRARSIAQAVLEREVFSARERRDVPRIRGLRGCARPLYDVLHDRAEIQDDVGAEAALILLENGQLRGSPLHALAGAEDGAWRAVAARDTENAKARSQRLAFFSDPDERVRRAALHSAVAAPDARDLESLLEVSRVDPDPLARSLAVRALGRIGGERVVFALKDRWQRADEVLRIAIVDAWSQPRALREGGRAELVRLVESSAGLAALHAAGSLLRGDEEVRDVATEKLLAAARHGSTEERRMALRLLPPGSPEALAELQAAADGPDPEVNVLANARLLEVPEQAEAAQERLRKMARGSGSPALQARAALASVGDGAVVPLLEAQLGDARASHRKAAAIGLFRLGRFSEAATILADDSPSVRTEAACTLVGAR